MPAIGPNFNAPQGRNTRRFELIESLTWQKGAHRFKFGGDLNPPGSVPVLGSKFEVPFAVTGKAHLEVVRIIESDVPEDETWWIYVRRKSNEER